MRASGEVADWNVSVFGDVMAENSEIDQPQRTFQRGVGAEQ